jgi:hypothetical protein
MKKIIISFTLLVANVSAFAAPRPSIVLPAEGACNGCAEWGGKSGG